MTDLELLDEYASSQSEDAFAAVVERYAGLVHSAALRQTGNRQIAEEVTQAVFVILAQKAGKFHEKSVLCGWLLRTTHFVAANARRKEFRRLQAEQRMADLYTTETDIAWKAMAPILDETLIGLNEANRNAISLRFFEGRSFKEIAQAMGTSAGAAEKRVSRALEMLRVEFRKRGLIVPSVLIVGAVSTHGVHAVPRELIADVCRSVSASTGPLAGVPSLVKATLESTRAAWRRTMFFRAAGAALIFVAAVAAYHDLISSNVPQSVSSEAIVGLSSATNATDLGAPVVSDPVKTLPVKRRAQESPLANLSGAVVDAETRQEIPDFEVWMGFDSSTPDHSGFNAVVNWSPTLQVSGRAGRFSFPLPMRAPPGVVSYNIEIRANGFQTAKLKAPAPLADASAFDFALERAPMISGLVLEPDGTPGAGAVVLVSAKNLGAYMPTAGKLDVDRSSGNHSETDEAGRFSVQAEAGTNTIFVAHSTGYFEAPLEQTSASQSITLQAWGRIEGTLKIGARPGSNETIFLGGRLSRQSPRPLNLCVSTATDSTGYFVIEKVPPGQWEIGQELGQQLPGDLRQKLVIMTQRSSIDVRAGETTFVTMGGTGSKVMGQIRAIDQTEPVDWRREFEACLTSKFPGSQSQRQYASLPDATGGFVIEDVLPGIYELSVQPYPPDPLRQTAPISLPQPLKKEVTVPEANSGVESESLDLGVLDLASRK